MKENFTAINVILDKSGSMSHLTSDTIGNFNKFLADQKAEPGEAIFTLATFSDRTSIVHNAIKLSDVPELNKHTYAPSGGTALLDAMGTTMTKVGCILSSMKEEDRPSKVIFLIITDGEENVSKEFTKSQIKDMVTHQSDKYSWEFVFMGANIDAISAGSSLGVSLSNSLNYSASSVGTEDLYKSVSDNLKSYRGSSRSAKGDFFVQRTKITDIPEAPIDTNLLIDIK